MDVDWPQKMSKQEKINVEILEFHFWPRVKPETCPGTKHNHYFYTACFVLQASYHFFFFFAPFKHVFILIPPCVCATKFWALSNDDNTN